MPGMIMDAAKDYNLDLGSSVLIGDKNSDIEAGISSKVGCNIFFQQSSVVSSNVEKNYIEISSLNLAKNFLKVKG